MIGRERLMAIKTTGFRKIGKVLLWTLMIFLLFKGVVSILDNKSQNEMIKTIDDYRVAAEQRDAARAGATAFAENFAYEYYSFDSQGNKEYPIRVGKYLAGSLDIPKPAGSGVTARVLSARAVKVGFADENRLDVDVAVKVHYEIGGEAVASHEGIGEAGDRGASSASTADKDLMIRIPLVHKEGRYAVDAIPMLIPKEDAANVSKAESYVGTEVSQKEKQEIRLMLESFLKTYYEGTDQELSYYISVGSSIRHGLNGTVAFVGIRSVSVYYMENDNEYLANAAIVVNDQGQEIMQEIYLTLNKEKNMFYIKGIATRAAGNGESKNEKNE